MDKIIGKTKSGKNIHWDFTHPAHKHYTIDDHCDAAEAHVDEFRLANDLEESQSNLEHHAKQNQLHQVAMIELSYG
jgi:hypothetical protein